MAQKCMYCNSEIAEDSVLSVCFQCGIKVWGEKMFKTIIQNMENARENGDLCHTKTNSEITDDKNLRQKLEQPSYKR